VSADSPTSPRDVVLLDYQLSNIRSAGKALEKLGAMTRTAQSGIEIGSPDAIVLPGVGHFGEAMRRIRDRDFAAPLTEAVESGTPLLGICLGMQLLFDDSDESPDEPGLGLLPGRVRPLVTDRKLPQIGWNSVRWAPGAALAPQGGDARDAIYYFVHSFVVEPSDPELVLGECDYGETFCAVAGRENVIGVQFHPEKSSDAGLGLLGRWLAGVGAPATA
jgi:imidazole glycerol phosphate synthase glutamine amidotransferase subunit